MPANEDGGSAHSKRIVVIEDGPYSVEGGIPLVIKTQIVSEHGEPLTWQKNGAIETGEGAYHLCRCGQSGHFPFCDGSHHKMDFDGTETAYTSTTNLRTTRVPGSTGIFIKKDPYLCTQSGFCGLLDVGLYQLAAGSRDTKIRSLIIAMVERCPAGALTYRFEENGPDIEPDLPQQVAVTNEITSDGPIAGPLWVTGEIEIVRSDGKPFERRNRVTLCNCGHSCHKPLCDGAHRRMDQQEERQSRVIGQ